VTVRVYLEGTGEGDALTAFAQFSRAATARKLPVTVEDPIAIEKGSGRFFVHVRHVDTREDAVAVVRAVLDQAPDAVAAFELVPVQEPCF
jgi:type II secretory ATPase GspE/PulE/Tfp pilus assembly ATPase PilB-like protein